MGFSRVASKYTCGIDFCMDFFLGIVVVCRSIIYIHHNLWWTRALISQ
jgi:hypothetical protein